MTMNKFIAILSFGICVIWSSSCTSGSHEIKVVDDSNKKDATYSLCKSEIFMADVASVGKYIADSKKISAEEWTELDHYACSKKFSFLEDGLKKELKVNLSGAGLLIDGEKTIYLNCDDSCMKNIGF
jgi:hypothetical protein